MELCLGRELRQDGRKLLWRKNRRVCEEFEFLLLVSIFPLFGVSGMRATAGDLTVLMVRRARFVKAIEASLAILPQGLRKAAEVEI